MNTRRTIKITLWDTFTLLVLVCACLFLVLVAAIFNNPNIGLNPFPPPTLPATLVIPTEEPTSYKLPPTWTPTTQTQTGSSQERSTPTLALTHTLFVVPTFTDTPTPTQTPTDTATPTMTSTPTKSPTWTAPATYTPLPTYTQPPTYTVVPISTSIRP
jgi:hypothetical protein